MSILKLARDPFKIDSGSWLNFDEENGLKLLPVFNPKVSKAYLDTLDEEGMDNLNVMKIASEDPEKGIRVMQKILSVAIVEWKGMSLVGGKAESIDEVFDILKDKRFEHLTAQALTFLVIEDNYRPDVVPTVEEIVKN